VQNLRLLALVATAFATPALSQSCTVDAAAVEAKITSYEVRYAEVLSDISCDTPTISAHQIMCASAESQDDLLWRMGRLNDLAWV
jgi:hypothetical protein